MSQLNISANIFLVIVVIVSFTKWTLAGAAAVDTRGLHSPGWDPVFSVGSALSTATNSTLWSGSRLGTFSQLAASSAPFYIDYLPLQPDEVIYADKIVALEFATAGICVAFNIGGRTRFGLTPDQLALLLMGNLTALGATLRVKGRGGPIATQDLRFILPSSTAAALLEVVGAAVTGDVNFTVAGALQNPKVSLVTTESAALTLVKSNNNNLTLTMSSNVLATREGLPCLQVMVPHRRYRELLVPTNPNTHIQGTDAEGVYPLVQRAFLFASVPFSCSHVEENVVFQQLEALVRSTTTTTLALWNIKKADFSEQLDALRTAFTGGELCGQSSVIPSGGSTAILSLAQAWSIDYMQSHAGLVLLDYVGGGSGVGLQGIKDHTFQIAGSDSLFSDQEKLDHPSVQFIPATAFAVSIIVNIPGAQTLTLTRCIAVAIFTGQVVYWDHPLIALHNPSVLLPHVTIRVWADSTRSGTTGIFTEGLAELNAACGVTDSHGLSLTTPVNATSTWNLFFPTLGLKTSVDQVVREVSRRGYSIGYASHGVAQAAGLVEAALLDDNLLVVSSPSVAAVTAALESATLDPEELTLSFALSPTAYPMVGVTYFVYHKSQVGNCSRMQKALDFMIWTYGAEADEIARALDYVRFPSLIRDQSTARIFESICDGVWLYPESGLKESPIPLLSIILATIAGVMTLSFFGGAFLTFCRSGNRNKYAPKDEGKAMSIIFTDIESSTSLWARGPGAMGAALDVHNAVIRRCISHHKAYEVKTIGDAFMIACYTPQQAVALAADCQMSLRDADWGYGVAEEINSLYQELHAEAGWVVTANQDTTLWHGLRVRMGIASGRCNIRLDQVTQGYDYFGNTCNLASRVESAAHGGQILIDEDTAVVAKSIPIIAFFEKGNTELKGIDEAVPLFQILPIVLKNRQFGATRESGVGTHLHSILLDSGSVSEEVSSASLDISSSSTTQGGASSDIGPPSAASIFVEVLLSTASESDKETLLTILCRSWRIKPQQASSYNNANASSTRQLADRVSAVVKVREKDVISSSNNSLDDGGSRWKEGYRPSSSDQTTTILPTGISPPLSPRPQSRLLSMDIEAPPKAQSLQFSMTEDHSANMHHPAP